ncbi:tetratricopeptide repeat protein (plasmid) [Rhizobium lusitanum]|uniref:tetratricopeptide repeat protein n=1 Tax=Rhizobium lusitanum TaxID=293958 RepID=UPI0016131CF5|nr:tetratricopeptide repeat protein [Rhizobium lusitanum]QND45502.1 tetratricopeptide repeat protein [Rhizobium lusitanum]
MRRELRIASTFLRAGHTTDDKAEVGVSVNALVEADAARDRRDWASAAFYYHEALQRNRTRIDLFVQLGHAYKELGDFDAALEAYRQFLDNEPHDADIHLQLGHLHNKMNDPAAALEWYNRASALAPNDPEITRHVDAAGLRLSRSGIERRRQKALELVHSGQWQQAREQLRSLVTVDGEIDLIAVYANVTKEAGDFEEALQLYEAYREYAKTNQPASLSDVEIQLGHLNKAKRDIGAALQHYILARDAEFHLYGHVAPNSICEREIRSCMGEIYTCFWQAD